LSEATTNVAAKHMPITTETAGRPETVNPNADEKRKRRMATNTADKSNQSETHPMAYGAKEAARVLGIGVRLLWTKTNSGEIPHFRLGRRVLYPVDQLRDWMARQIEKPKK